MFRNDGRRRKRLQAAAKIVVHFFLGQGALQAVNILLGLFLVRILSVEAYAQFGLAYGFQMTVMNLMDLGFASTIIPLVGDRAGDRALVGRYIRSAKHLRDRAFIILAPPAGIAFLALMHKHHWDWHTQLLLLLSVLLSLYSAGKVSYYSAPYFLYGRLREFFVPQTLFGLLRLAACGLLQVLGELNAWTASALSALNISLSGSWLGKEGHNLIEWPATESPETERQIFRYVLPAAPAIIFSAFQSQISLFLISIFGHTASIAQVAALGKIGQLFAVLMSFNVMVVEPYIARLSRDRLLSTYLLFILIAALCCLPVALCAFVWPSTFLWLLGAKYEVLKSSVGWVVLGACINYLAGLIWIMNRARKWLFWSGTILEIVLLVGMQIAFIIFVGVSTTRQAVFFTFASSFCYIVAHSYVGIYGFLKGPRIA
jgi:O-antigen/teichoic acid export membrane protein